MICATLPALGYWRPTNGAPGYVPSLLSASWSQILLFAKPLPIHLPSHHFCLSTSSEQFRIFGLVSYKIYAVQLIDWSAIFECGLSVNRISKFASIFWLVSSEKLAATPHHQSFKDSFHQAYDHDQLHMVVFCQFSCHHWHLFSVTRRSRNDVLVNGYYPLKVDTHAPIWHMPVRGAPFVFSTVLFIKKMINNL